MKSRADLCTIEGFDSLETDTSGNPCVWLNHYNPGTEYWCSAWSCQCDDDGIEPYFSEWIGPADSTLRALWEALPEAGTTDLSPLEGRYRRPCFSIAELASLLVELGPEGHEDRNPLYDKLQKILLEELNPGTRAIHDAYRDAFREQDGEVEIDRCEAEVSLGSDPGAYVMTWSWVTNEEAGITMEVKEDDEPSA